MNMKNILDQVTENLENLMISNHEAAYACEYALENIECGFDEDELNFIVDYFKNDYEKIADYLLYFWTNVADDLTFLTASQAEEVHSLYECQID